MHPSRTGPAIPRPPDEDRRGSSWSVVTERSCSHRVPRRRSPPALPEPAAAANRRSARRPRSAAAGLAAALQRTDFDGFPQMANGAGPPRVSWCLFQGGIGPRREGSCSSRGRVTSDVGVGAVGPRRSGRGAPFGGQQVWGRPRTTGMAVPARVRHGGARMRVAIFGLGYVGTVTAAGLASQGHDVVGVDVERSKVAAICRGESPVVEPGVDRLVAQAVAAGRLRATTDVREAIERADVSLVCVGTPVHAARRHQPRRYIARALADLREAMADVAPPPASGFHSVVIRSTVPPGTGRTVVEPGVPAPSCCPTGGPSAPPCAPSSCARGPGSTTSSPRRSWSSEPGTRAPGRPASELFDFLDQEIRPRRRRHRRGPEVRLQRLPRGQGDLRQRDGPDLLAVRRRLARRHGDLLRGPQAQHLADATCGPGSRSVGPACPRTCGPCRAWRGRAASTCPSLSSTLISNEIIVRSPRRPRPRDRATGTSPSSG